MPDKSCIFYEAQHLKSQVIEADFHEEGCMKKEIIAHSYCNFQQFCYFRRPTTTWLRSSMDTRPPERRSGGE